MSNFWIQISTNGMPIAVQKYEFYPSHLGFNWENFGKRGELGAKNVEIARLKRALQEIVKIDASIVDCDCHRIASAALEGEV